MFVYFSDYCNIWNITSVSLDLMFSLELTLENGMTYFVTVTAVNSAGLSASGSSDGVTVDATPPSIHGFSLEAIVSLKVQKSDVSGVSGNPYAVTVVWNVVDDIESDIRRLSICVGRSNDTCDLQTWIDINLDALSFTVSFPRRLQSGTVFTVCLMAENGARLKTSVCSDNIIIDTTTPVKGVVRVGRNNGKIFFNEDQTLRFTWSGFSDPESGLKLYKWRMCLTISECSSPFVETGNKTSISLSISGIEHGKQYHIALRAVNYIGLEAEAKSNAFVLDKTSPEVGAVFDGAMRSIDLSYSSSASEISANWNHFRDKESSIMGYEICVGSRRGLCDVKDYTDVGLVNVFTIINLKLTHNSTYYTSIRTTNGAGLTNFASSNGIVTDLTPPVGGLLRDGDFNDIDITMYDSFVCNNWDRFSDPESGILKYVMCAGSTQGLCDILPPLVITTGLSVKHQVSPSIASGTMVYSTLKVYNQAGGMTVVYSDGVMVDSTPTIIGKVFIL